MQQTIGREIRLEGKGIHGGLPSSVCISPAPGNSGVMFDAGSCGKTPVRATIDQVTQGNLRTAIGCGSASISTIEHLMAALHAADIDNVHVEVLGSELPIFDGSAQAWFDAIIGCGAVLQDQPRRRIRVLKSIKVSHGLAWCSLEPSVKDGLRLTYDLHFDHPMMGDQQVDLALDGVIFGKELAGARTFGFLQDLPRMERLGLAQGADASNTVVFTDHGVMNPDGLRWADEPARHKVVDALGDLYLSGHQFIGHFRGYQSGHALNQQLVRCLWENTGSWCWA